MFTDRALDVGVAAEIGKGRQRRDSVGFDLADERPQLDLGPGKIDDGEIETIGGETERNTSADAPAGAGDDGRATTIKHVHVSPWWIDLGCRWWRRTRRSTRPR